MLLALAVSLSRRFIRSMGLISQQFEYTAQSSVLDHVHFAYTFFVYIIPTLFYNGTSIYPVIMQHISLEAWNSAIDPPAYMLAISHFWSSHDTCTFIQSLSHKRQTPLIMRHYGPMIALTSHTRTLSSHPQLAHHPSAPKRHQSTPVTNSVCRPILPISLPPPNTMGSAIISSFECPIALPSVHTRHVIS